MDGAHLAAVAHVTLNPVRAGLSAVPEDWLRSSARAHLSGRDDMLVEVRPVLDRLGDFRSLLAECAGEEAVVASAGLRAAETTGRPAAAADFGAALDRRLGRPLAPRKAGRKPTKSLQS